MAYYHEQPSVRTVHTFGMNFLPSRGNVHAVESEQRLHEACCTNCAIHATPRQTYLP